ncbi:unnamed protein product [Rotaria magnacalcarata]|uniref:Gag-like protein n=5 Tax=Rotaria magnacalcarata TaxID=392030 RepID=A0A816V7V3_9BILA|nr:unnamed protein product [Rotaria magnacalcarata]CAF1462197.1 unnamed protein product [Rotaria magnacalcarata]CAF2084858.1 unnamed protein product [Rotaria magnacalcarata]CAF2120507.1 unnamed protein product [Rotaria magnacalcarata]CAF4040582.1 unnamed protein product [Rotaria magnacalcarata]
MPPKTGGGVAGGKQRNQNLNNQLNQSAVKNGHSQVGRTPLAGNSNQPKFTIAPLIIEGVKISKLQLNDLLKQHLNDVKIHDIQLSRSGSFTLYASDVTSFNRLLNEFTLILAANGQQTAKIFVPRSIQRIKDTEMVAFVKRVDLDIPDNRITDALKKVGLDVINVTRLNKKEGNIPTSTIKITFMDANNRNTFIHTGLQVDSMHFVAEAASQNKKPVQCYICLQYNHVAKYCKTKQQVCSRCGDNHRIEQCTATNDAIKCNNCKGKHLATANDCPKFLEQEKRMLNLINQYSSTSKPMMSSPLMHDMNEFPSLPNIDQRQQNHLHNDIFDELINLLTTKMEKIIEETTKRLFKSLQQKIKKIEKTISSVETLINDDIKTSDSSSDSDEEIQILSKKNNKQQQPTATTQKPKKQVNKPTTTSADTTAKPPTTTTKTSTQSAITTNDSVKKPTPKQKPTAKTSKRNRSLDSSLDSTIMDPKDRKTDTIND